jgi:hypothetical protein
MRCAIGQNYRLMDVYEYLKTPYVQVIYPIQTS